MAVVNHLLTHHRDTAAGAVALRVRRIRPWMAGTGILFVGLVVVRRV